MLWKQHEFIFSVYGPCFNANSLDLGHLVNLRMGIIWWWRLGNTKAFSGRKICFQYKEFALFIGLRLTCKPIQNYDFWITENRIFYKIHFSFLPWLWCELKGCINSVVILKINAYGHNRFSENGLQHIMFLPVSSYISIN